MEDVRTPNGILLAHADHGLAKQHLEFIDTVLSDWTGQFILIHREIPEDCPPLLSGLYGPGCGDDPVSEEEVEYVQRENRPGPSRTVNRKERSCRMIVIIAGPGYGSEGIIYTAFGSQVIAPKEWWDPSMVPWETIESAKFWCNHALATGEE